MKTVTELEQQLADMKKALKGFSKKHLITELFHACMMIRSLDEKIRKLENTGAPAEQLAKQAPNTFGNEKE